MKVKLTDITDIIRSKNSGPYELTVDLMFSNFDWYKKVCAAGAVNEQVVCGLYKIKKEDIINIIHFDPAKAIKVTIKRPLCSGDPGETDVYGAQQHAPFLNLELDL
ncbi:acyl-CoA synthetase [Spirochaetia bacterium]|nr:acyl-CoA synthetase [Spirochaetia bacterium]